MSLAYAIGDVHGMYDMMMLALEQISKREPGRIIFLGDLMDRGPNSYDCVRHVKAMCDSGVAECVAGNHENMMYANDAYIWNMNGARETLKSYREVSPDIYDEHVEWMRRLPSCIDTGKHFFVHGGINPKLPPDKQDHYDMIWARFWQDDIKPKKGWHGRHVVYGHTPYKTPKLMIHSTGLDTGAVYGNALSVGVFDLEAGGGPIDIFQIGSVIAS